jgi:hypothetical protein
LEGKHNGSGLSEQSGGMGKEKTEILHRIIRGEVGENPWKQ